MAVLAYARVSSDSQVLDSQLLTLAQAGVALENVYSDAAVSGMVRGADRPGYSALLAALKPGDVLTVVRLDRLGRSAVEVLSQVESLQARGVVVRSLADGVDSSTPSGRMILGVMSSLAAYERETLRERQRAGIEAARAKNKHLGRPSRLSSAQKAHARQLALAGATHQRIAELLGCSLSTARRAAVTA